MDAERSEPCADPTPPAPDTPAPRRRVVPRSAPGMLLLVAVVSAAAAITLASIIAMRGSARARSSDAERAAATGASTSTALAPATVTAINEVAAAAVAPTASTPAALTPQGTPAPVSAAGERTGSRDSAAPPNDAAIPTPTSSQPAVIADPPPGTRDKRLWPFSVDSIWNMPIGADAVYVPGGMGQASSVSIDEEYFVFPSPSDPLRPFYTNGIWGTGRCATTTFQYNINIPDSFLVPDATHRATPNAAAAILAADGRTLKQMNPVSRCEPGGPLTAGWMAPDQDIYGPGILGAHGGSGLSSIGGSLRKGEITSPDPIRHALKVNLWGRRWLSQADGGHRWPAVAADSFYDDPDNSDAYGGPLPQLRMGALLAIPADVDIRSLGLKTPAANKLAWTLQNYGAYVVDDTTWDTDALDVEAGVAEEFQAAYGYGIEASDGPWYDDMMRIFGLLAVVDNNGPDSIGGGGTPRQPLAPPIGN